MAESARIGFNPVNTLFDTAATYHTLMDAISEMVQNAIDANAPRIRVIVDQKKRNVTIQDSGDGVSREDFDACIADINASRKPQGKYGKFGKGVVSPIGKCERYTITSCPKPQTRGFLEWIFDTKELESKTKEDDLRIPVVERDDFCIDVMQPRRGETKVDWRTQIRIQRYTKDRFISRFDLDELNRAIAGRYEKALRARQIDITITLIDETGRERSVSVRARGYRGHPLKEVTIANKEGGDTIFQLYLAAKSGKGVFVGESDDPFRLEFATLARAAGDLLPRDVVRVLTSSVFEGEILSSRSKLHPNRKQFEENDALVGFCAAIAAWYKEVGQPYLEDLKQEGKEQRYKQTWLETLRTLQTMLKDPEFAALNDLIDSFKRGTVGDEHIEPPPSRVVGKQDVLTTSTNGGGGKTKGENINGAVEPPKPPDEEKTGKKTRKSHKPLTTDGNGRQRRTVVINDSRGLQIRCDAPVDSDKLYELDARNGILFINVRHPQWVQCEDVGSDEVLISFQRVILIEALTLASSNPNWVGIQEFYAEDMRKALVFTLVHEARTRPPSAPKKQPATAAV